jgi:hypothetical protein
MIFGTEQITGQLWRVLTNRGNMLPAEERGAKMLGPLAALGQLAQFALLFALGGALMLQPMHAPGQVRVVYAIFGVTYAMQARSCCTLRLRA